MKKNTIKTSGTNCATAYFEKSGIRFGGKMTQRPFLAFREKDDHVAVEIVDDVEKLITYPGRTKVMAQWEGKKRSNWVRFTVGDLRKHVEANPPHNHQVI